MEVWEEIVNKVVESLVKLGFGVYEAKGLTALMALGPSTAREVHEASGVPRPKVYETLRRLAEKGFVEVQHGRPTVYASLPHDAVVRILEDRFGEALSELASCLRKLTAPRRLRAVRVSTLKGEGCILGKLKELLAGAEREVFLVLAAPEMMQRLASIVRAYSGGQEAPDTARACG